MNSQQFESNYNKLRTIIQACLKSNKILIASVIRRHERVRPDGGRPQRQRQRQKQKQKRISKARQTKHRVLHVRIEESLGTRLLVTNPPTYNSTRGGRYKSGCRRSKGVCVNDWEQSQRCELGPKWLRKLRRRIGDDRQRSIRQRLPQVVWADARTLQD